MIWGSLHASTTFGSEATHANDRRLKETVSVRDRDGSLLEAWIASSVRGADAQDGSPHGRREKQTHLSSTLGSSLVVPLSPKDVFSNASMVSPIADLLSRSRDMPTWWSSHEKVGSGTGRQASASAMVDWAPKAMILTDQDHLSGAASLMPSIHLDIGVFVGGTSVVLYNANGEHVASCVYKKMRSLGYRHNAPAAALIVNKCMGTSNTTASLRPSPNPTLNFRHDKEFHDLTNILKDSAPTNTKEKDEVEEFFYAELDLVECTPRFDSMDDSNGEAASPNYPYSSEDQSALSSLQKTESTLIVLCGVGREGVTNLWQIQQRITESWDNFLENGGAERCCNVVSVPSTREVQDQRSRRLVVPPLTSILRSHSGEATDAMCTPNVLDRNAVTSTAETRRLVTGSSILANARLNSSLRKAPSNMFAWKLPADVDVTVIGSSAILDAHTDDTLRDLKTVRSAPPPPEGVQTALKAIQSFKSNRTAPMMNNFVSCSVDDVEGGVMLLGARTGNSSGIIERKQTTTSESPSFTAALDVKTRVTPPSAACEYPITCVVCGCVFDLRRRQEHLSMCRK